MKDRIVTETDSNGYGKQRVIDRMKKGYKVSSSSIKVKEGGGYYAVYTLVRKNWLERLFNL